jgi:hypothetical protein
LKQVVEIRNHFAHSLSSGLTFESPAIRSKVLELAVPDVSSAPDVRSLWAKSTRQRFMFAFQLLFFTLEFIADRIEPLTPLKLPGWKITHGKPNSAV